MRLCEESRLEGITKAELKGLKTVYFRAHTTTISSGSTVGGEHGQQIVQAVNPFPPINVDDEVTDMTQGERSDETQDVGHKPLVLYIVAGGANNDEGFLAQDV